MRSRKDIDTIIENKKSTILGIVNASPAPGIPTDLAQITTPQREDTQIADLVENAIKEFVELNVKNGSEFRCVSLDQLHNWLPVDLLSSCQAHVTDNLQREMMSWAVSVGRNRLQFKRDFFVDKEVYVRINYPFDIASDGMRSDISDPNHRLTKYNKGRPRQTWGHGPHKDSWYGHSHTAINLWFAVCGTNEQSTMTLYPEHAYKATAFNEESMYASYSENLGLNVPLKLERGENFIFDPELLHSTRVNTSDETRVVLTLRLAEAKPAFSNKIKHDIYNYWLRADDIEKGSLDAKEVGYLLKIDDYPETSSVQEKYVHKVKNALDLSGNSLTRSDFKVADNVIFEINGADINCLGVWNEGNLYKFGKNCPHIGAPLIGGYFDIKKLSIKCPAHGVEFCIKDGSSESNKLRLRVFE